MPASLAIAIADVFHNYGARQALAGVTFDVARGEIFMLLGPNGGGKTTLFRLLSTLIPVQRGSLRVLDFDVTRQAAEVRCRIGVAFQAPSLDRKLTVRENLLHQGHLYGLSGPQLSQRIAELLQRFALGDRARDRVETLSGGLRRRVELAKAVLHVPALLLLDEPSTGLDPGVRSELWRFLLELRERDGLTVVLTTHLLEEAERADRLAILDQGKLVALDTPGNLRAEVGGDTISLEADRPEELATAIQEKFSLEVAVVDSVVRLNVRQGHRLIAPLAEAFPGRIRAMTVGQPTLEDVFIARTGHRFSPQESREPAVFAAIPADKKSASREVNHG